MDTYNKAIKNILDGLTIDEPDIETLRKACSEGRKLDRTCSKLEMRLRSVANSEVLPAGFIDERLLTYEIAISGIEAAANGKDFSAVKLDNAVTQAHESIARLLNEFEAALDSAESTQKAALEDQQRKAEEEKARMDEQLREEESWRRRKQEEEQRVLDREQAVADNNTRALQAAVDTAAKWRSGIVRYSKQRFTKLIAALVASGCFCFFFLSWKSGLPGIVLLVILAGIVGPFGVKPLVRERLADKCGALVEFDNLLGFGTGGLIGIIQLICGAVISPTLWLLGKSAAWWQILFPIGWAGLFGFLLVLPCALIAAWLWGGFYAGIAGKRILKRNRLSDLLMDGEAQAGCPNCGQPVIVREEQGGSVVTCSSCGQPFSVV